MPLAAALFAAIAALQTSCAPFDAAPVSRDARADAPLEFIDGNVSHDDAAVTANASLHSPSGAVTFHIDPAHRGVQPFVRIALPLTRRWIRDLAGATSYAVAVSGLAFVTSSRGELPGASLVALDVETGATRWGPVVLPGSTHWSALAYDGGRVFVVNGDGDISAYDALSGDIAWHTRLHRQYGVSAAPTAFDGLLFVSAAGSGGTLHALRERDGEVAWTAPVQNGDFSSPTVGYGRVFVSYSCNQAYSFDEPTGALLWHHRGSCEGGGGRTTVLSGTSLYTRDISRNLVLDDASGLQTGVFVADAIPAIDGDTRYVLHGGSLRALSTGAGMVRWSFTGDGTLVTAPIVVGSNVVIGSARGTLYVIDRRDGTVLDTDSLASMAVMNEQSLAAPPSGLTAGEGMLFVPTSTGLAAYAGTTVR